MNDNSDFEINYWGNTPDHQSSKKPRSFKSKVLIVVCFIAILGITPTLVFGLNKIQISKSNQISSAAIPSPAVENKAQEKLKTPTPTPTVSAQVLKGDSYWRLSKRNCGTGIYYLSIKDQNENKPLYQGNLVKISCAL